MTGGLSKIMRYIYILFCFIFFIEISTYAGEVKGKKLVLGSYATFTEAKKVLASTGETLTNPQLALLNQYHCSLLARPSGKVYILVIEPLADEKEAKIVQKYFSSTFPDAYISPYFSPTKDVVFWTAAEAIESNHDKMLSNSATLLPFQAPRQQISFLETKGSQLLIAAIVVSFFLIGVLLFLFIVRGKKKKELTLMSMHGDFDTHKALSIKEEERTLSLWDYNVALRRTGGNKQLLEERIQTFIAKGPAIVGRLKEVMLDKEWDNIIAYACSLKSISADIAATLRIVGKDLESAAREQNSDVVAASIAECERILNNTLSSLQKHIAREEMVKIMTESSSETEDIDTLEALRTSLEKSIFVDTEKVSVFKHYDHGNISDEIQELKRSVRRLDYTKALKLLQHIEGMLQ